MRGVTRAGLAVAAVAAAFGPAPRADAAPACVTTPIGIECTASGGTTETIVRPGGPGPTLPPVRYLVVAVDARVGTCWYWSRSGPGLDSWRPGDEHAIIMTRTLEPACPPVRRTPVVDETFVSRRAWEVFRSFPLPPPDPRVVPWPSGFANHPSTLVVSTGPRFSHDETLPDGSGLAVRAHVGAVIVHWGDDSPALVHDPAAASSGIRHAYGMKTCSQAYREEHPAGALCHPRLDRYDIEVTAVWEARYRRDGPWLRLGEISRNGVVPYDVDEVVGVPGR
ncbi:MAG: hypothetical protein R3290_10025 [Acidimicrobiia bacterium]|nr:hypothetical protein [Acidimicrobiia bacterium]